MIMTTPNYSSQYVWSFSRLDGTASVGDVDAITLPND